MNRRLRVALVAVGTLVIGSISILIAVMVHLEILPAATPPLDREYVAVSFNGRTYADRSRILKLSRSGDGYSLYAYAGCNHFVVRVRFVIGGRLSVLTSGGMTAMGCRDQDERDKDAEYFGALQKMKRWRIESEKLIFEGDKDSLQFEAATK